MRDDPYSSAPAARLRDALFAPKSIALIGASADTAKNNSRPQRYLKKHGYRGRVIPINPGRSEIFGRRRIPISGRRRDR